MMQERLRIELRFKNAELWNTIRAKLPPTNHHQTCGDIRNLAKRCRINRTTIYGYLNLCNSPWGKDGEPCPTAEKLSQFLQVDCETLFPKRLYSGVLPRRLSAEVDGSRYLSLAEARQQRLLPRSTEDLESSDVDQLDKLKALQEILQTLKPREQEVIKMRFGLDGPEFRLLEIGEKFGLTRERIRQIEKKAISKMRYRITRIPF